MRQVATQTHPSSKRRTSAKKKVVKTMQEAIALDEKKTKGVSMKEKEQLFEMIEDSDEELKEAKKAFEAAEDKRSRLIQELDEKCGSGPFRRNGKILRIARRGGKFFFRSENIEEIEEIG